MARKSETGLSYFPLNTDIVHNPKIKLVVAEFGPKAWAVLLSLYCKIYREKGYWIDWMDEDNKLLFAQDECKCDLSFVDEVVAACIRRDLFDKIVFDMYGVLTSDRIQANYFEGKKRNKEVVFIDQFLVENDDVDINSQNVRIIQLNVDIIKKNVDIGTQSRGRRRIELEGEGESPPPPLLPEFLEEGLIYDAESDLLKNQIAFESICCAAGKKMETGLYALKKFHLWATGKELYPKARKALYAMFQSWLMDEREGKKIPAPPKSGPSAREREEAENRKKLGIDGAD